ncbi:hypothetical protein [Methanosarcina sp. 2.H.A.1B.4]|uniref:hypothetical protein n=1 Tax=Methanosarcina sp. 2.H.A.1B.4 TaxID=1483600 RepID=UPI0006227F75|nr:hypothetical protein [Methanosarcina sp. 2.H.A.1B.4]KKG11445.1 hypothetical protein EO92_10805 [Methanosarcina sp. 2.H.A.1B.4]
MLPNAAFTKKEPDGKKEGVLSRLSRSESAAVTAIAAVLLLALVFTVLSVVKLGYVPEWKSNAEQNHMYDTWDDIVGVKTRVDILSRYMDSGNYSAYGLSATVPFNLGGGEVPVFEPSKSDGKLEVNTERCAMTITPFSPTQKISPYTLECGGITCYSENKQYPDQIFRYENGALILANDESSVMKQSPALHIKEDENKTGNYTFLIQAVQLLGKQNSVSSNTIVPLRLTGWGIDPVHDSQEYENLGTNITGFNLTIATKYPDAWASYFNETAQNQGFEYGKEYTVEYLPDSGSVRLSFLSSGSKAFERLYVSKTIIGAELGAGNSFNYANYGAGAGAIIPSGTSKVMKLNQWYSFDTFTGTYKQKQLSPNPALLEDYNESYLLPEGDFQNQPLNLYTEVNNFSYYIESKKSINLILGLDNFDTFESNVTTVTVRMIYKFEDNEEPTMEMTLGGVGADSFKPNGNKWCLYNHKFTMQPSSPDDLTLNLKVTSTNNDIEGTFHIDYLAVRLD